MKILPIAFNNKKNGTFTAVYADEKTVKLVEDKLGKLFNIRYESRHLGLSNKKIGEIPTNLWASAYEYMTLFKRSPESPEITSGLIFDRIQLLKNGAKELKEETFNSFVPQIDKIQKTYNDAMSEVNKTIGLR